MSNNNTTVNMGSPVDNVQKPKQGHSFLGCLCDMRRAVIMLDTLGLIGGILSLIAIILIEKYGSEDDVKVLSDAYSFGGLIAIQCAVTLCHLSGIFGAVSFSICPVVITILMDFAYAVISSIDKNWYGLAIYIFLLYPHAVLCNELAEGIMTRENYRSQERQSCCCV